MRRKALHVSYLSQIGISLYQQSHTVPVGPAPSRSQAHLIGIKDGHASPQCSNVLEIIIKKRNVSFELTASKALHETKKKCLYMSRHGPSVLRELGQRQREVGRFIGVESAY